MSDLNSCARRLLDFVMQSVEDGISDPATMLECFSEADKTLDVFHNILSKDDEHKSTQLALLGIWNLQFVRDIAKHDEHDRKDLLGKAMENLAVARTFFV